MSDPRRTDLPSDLPAPTIRCSTDTGGEVAAVLDVEVEGAVWAVVLAGSVLQAADATGRVRWSMTRRVVSRLIAAGDLAGTGVPLVLVRGTLRELLLLDARTGGVVWSWVAPDGTFVNDAGAVLLVPRPDGHRLVVAPIYGTTMHAFDLVATGPARPVWELQGSWDPGFGPSLVHADMDRTGQARIVLSSRRGDEERTHGGRHTTAQTVLGRRRGRLYQAVVDPEDGRVLREVAWAPNPRGHRAARPYGLLTAVAFEPGGPPGIVLACCQVEEYLAVTRQRPDGTLERAWSRFVEKDWPHDRQELRVHPDSVRDLRGDGRPELVASLWDGERWRTSVHDLATGHDRAGDRLRGRVHWGCIARADGGTSIVVSEAQGRPVGGPTTLELVDGATLEVIDRLEGAQVIVGRGGELPGNVAYMAERRGMARVPVEGGDAVAIRADDASLDAWWADAGGTGRRGRLGGVRSLAVFGVVDGVVVADEGGRVERLDRSLRRAGHGAIETHGRVASLAVAWQDGPVVHMGLPGGRIRDVRPSGHPAGVTEDTDGVHLSLRRSAEGQPDASARMVVDEGVPTLQVVSDAHGPVTVSLDAPLDRPAAWCADGSLLLTLRTGTHTLATERRTIDGSLVWRIELGAYLHGPSPLVVDGAQLVAIDDHGVLALVDADALEPVAPDADEAAARRPVVRWRRDWTALYSHPIAGPFLRDGAPGILRADGIHGLELLDARGRRRWRVTAPLWQYAAGEGVVARSMGRWVLVTGRRDGALEAREVRDGRSCWVEPVADTLDAVALAAGDLDGDGDDEVVVGLPDGRLLALRDVASGPTTHWATSLDAGVASIVLVEPPALPAPADGARPRPALAVATVDGRVHLLG